MPQTDFYEKYQIGSGHGDKNIRINRISAARRRVVCGRVLRIAKTGGENGRASYKNLF